MIARAGIIFRDDAPMAGYTAAHRLLDFMADGHPDCTNREVALMMVCAWTFGPHRFKDVAAKLNAPGPAVTRALRSLEKLGFACRSGDPHDKRQVYIEITDAGRHYLELLIS